MRRRAAPTLAALLLAVAGGAPVLAQQAVTPETPAPGAEGLPAGALAQLEETGDIPPDPAVVELQILAESVGVPDQLLQLLATGDPRGESAIAEFLAAGNPAPQEVSARAVALANAVRNDPVVARGNRELAINDQIGRAVSSTLCAPRVVTVNLAPDYVPPAGVLAYDFGGWDTPLAEGFERLTPASQQVYGNRLSIQEQVGDGAVLEDAVAGLSNLVFDVPNGDYRVILLTTPQVADAAQQPFGASFGINGVAYYLGTATSDTWWSNGNLGGGGAQRAPLMPVGGQGGGILAQASVADGVLQLDFDGGYSGLSAVLSGLLIEPAGLPSSLVLEDKAVAEQLALEDCLELELLTQVAMLDSLAPAAGPQAVPAAARTGQAIAQAGGLDATAAPFDGETGATPTNAN